MEMLEKLQILGSPPLQVHFGLDQCSQRTPLSFPVLFLNPLTQDVSTECGLFAPLGGPDANVSPLMIATADISYLL